MNSILFNSFLNHHVFIKLRTKWHLVRLFLTQSQRCDKTMGAIIIKLIETIESFSFHIRP